MEAVTAYLILSQVPPEVTKESQKEEPISGNRVEIRTTYLVTEIYSFTAVLMKWANQFLDSMLIC
jgi:hypothetical protein